MNVSLWMKDDSETNGFGQISVWYGYAIAFVLHGVQHMLWKDFMLQVWMIHIQIHIFVVIGNLFTNANVMCIMLASMGKGRKEVCKTFILHYTNECDFSMKGN